MSLDTGKTRLQVMKTDMMVVVRPTLGSIAHGLFKEGDWAGCATVGCLGFGGGDEDGGGGAGVVAAVGGGGRWRRGNE